MRVSSADFVDEGRRQDTMLMGRNDIVSVIYCSLLLEESTAE